MPSPNLKADVTVEDAATVASENAGKVAFEAGQIDLREILADLLGIKARDVADQGLRR